jgi:hypothetical protein
VLCLAKIHERTFRPLTPDEGVRGYMSPLLRQDLADAPNLRSYSAQLFFNVLIAAVNVIDAVNNRFALGH